MRGYDFRDGLGALVASIAGNRATAHRILASLGEPTARWGAARNPRAKM
jgi:hypothetical protein